MIVFVEVALPAFLYRQGPDGVNGLYCENIKKKAGTAVRMQILYRCSIAFCSVAGAPHCTAALLLLLFLFALALFF
jgi:hypothetical protein